MALLLGWGGGGITTSCYDIIFVCWKISCTIPVPTSPSGPGRKASSFKYHMKYTVKWHPSGMQDLIQLSMLRLCVRDESFSHSNGDAMNRYFRRGLAFESLMLQAAGPLGPGAHLLLFSVEVTARICTLLTSEVPL